MHQKTAPISQLYPAYELAQVDQTNIPKHIAIIPDGNRRWAKQRLSSSAVGHREGCDTIIEIVKAARELGVKALTIYTFSTENWNRPKAEIDALMNLLQEFLIRERQTMIDYGVRLQTIGIPERLPEFVKQELAACKAATADGNQIDFILAINYGSKDEMCRTFKKLLEQVQNGTLHPDAITPELISRHLDTAPWPDPDLLIRTGGEHRTSNFLLWQTSYAELYLSDILWPDFAPRDLLQAIKTFQKRERRLGT